MIKTNKKVIVGLSGGVDSSVAVHLLKAQGFEPIGVTMEIYRGKPLPSAGNNSCYGHEKTDIEQIRALCKDLDIPFYCFDCSAEFQKAIISYFKSEYLAGRTPNPCVKCNELIKFALLPQKAREAGIDFAYFATGHYAQIAKVGERYYLKQAADKAKDQTYFLYRLENQTLAHTLFPLGAMTKDETRAFARAHHLDAIAAKRESQDFYAGAYADILNIPPKPGEFIDETGKVLGTHSGYWHYTLGQRKGMGIAHPAPLYVTAINPAANQVTVSCEKKPAKNYAVITDYFLNPVSNTAPIFAKIRSTGILLAVKSIKETATKCTDSGEGTSTSTSTNTAKVFFAKETPFTTPGQSLVLYQDGYVIGGGTLA